MYEGLSPKILIAGPTGKVKDYCLDQFEAACKVFTYPNCHHLLVDTTPDDGEHAEMLRSRGFEVIEQAGNPTTIVLLVTMAWEEIIIPYAYENGYEYILSLESDIIAPPETLTYLLNVSKLFDASIVSHSYPRNPAYPVPTLDYRVSLLRQSLGCTLFRNNFVKPGEGLLDYFEVYLYDIARYHKLKIVTLENVLPLEHLKEYML